LNKYSSIEPILQNENNHLFEIETNEEKFYLISSYFKVFENDLEFHQTSLGLSNSGITGRLISNSLE